MFTAFKENHMTAVHRMLATGLLLTGLSFAGEALSAEAKAKIEAKLTVLKAWGSEATLVKAVKEAESNQAAKDMTQDKWKSLTVIDPIVRGFTTSPAAAWIKSKRDGSVTEVFISNAKGIKVAFLTKPTSWSHKGKPKHDVPMTGKTWIGEAEIDESTGQKQVQASFPVLEDGKPIGSIVVGFALFKL